MIPVKTFHPGRRSPAKGFSLIEIMAVICIIGIMLAVSVPALSSFMESNNLTRAGQLLSDQIGLARQMASSRNAVVEIRLLKLSGSAASGYDAIQLWMTEPSGESKALNRVAKLPQNTVISEKATVSAAFGTDGLSGSYTMPASVGIGANAPYALLQIQPGGTLIPTLAMNSSSLTIVPSKEAQNTSLPNNYVTIQINPLTGTPIVYRP